MSGRHPVIAIDGASATGKTSTAAGLAARLGFAYVDSGSIYRAVALALDRAGIVETDDPRIPDLLGALDLEVRPEGTRFVVRLAGLPIGEEIRSPEVTRASSRFAVRADVRDRVRTLLRSAAEEGPLVVEGRDIGTVVFPDAPLKLFLTADLDVRAARRQLDLQRLGRSLDRVEVAAEMAERDARDSSRSLSPLRAAPDAITVDTGSGTLAEQIAQIVALWEARAPGTDPPGPGPRS